MSTLTDEEAIVLATLYGCAFTENSDGTFFPRPRGEGRENWEKIDPAMSDELAIKSSSYRNYYSREALAQAYCRAHGLTL